MTTSDTFNIGIIGAGRQSGQHRLPSFLAQADSGVRVLAIADPVTEAATRLAEATADRIQCEAWHKTGYDVRRQIGHTPRVYATPEEMLRAERNLRAVAIVSPHQFHVEQTELVLSHGLNVLLEKPGALTKAGAQRLLAAANAARTADGRPPVVTVGYQSAPVLSLALADGGREMLGTIVGGRIAWERALGIPDDAHFWNDAETTGVGVDLLPHLIAGFLAAEGPDAIVSVERAVGSRRNGVALMGDGFKGFDTIEATVRLRNGKRLVFAASWATGVMPDDYASATLVGESGSMLRVPLPVHKGEGYTPRPGALRAIIESDQHMPVMGRVTPSFVELIAEQARNFVAAVRGEETVHLSLEQAMGAERIVRMIQSMAVASDAQHAG